MPIQFQILIRTFFRNQAQTQPPVSSGFLETTALSISQGFMNHSESSDITRMSDKQAGFITVSIGGRLLASKEFHRSKEPIRDKGSLLYA